MNPVLLLDVVGLTPRALADMPRLRRLAASGWQTSLETVLPAVTCSVQSTMLTGRPPAEHGAVGNGWYFRDLGEVFLWRQHNALVEAEKVWDALRRRHPDARVANVCWWFAMGMDVDSVVTPRPIYHADGRKSPDCYTRPPALHDRLVDRLGPFPLFHYWGPTASIASSRWIVEATRMLLPEHDLTLAYVPHLDYDLQRFGPESPQARAAAREVDAVLAPLLDDAERLGVSVLVVSEYGITAVDQPVDVNRVLRRAGLLEVHTQAGMEYLDPWTSEAFAVADHQVAHVYVRDPDRVAEVRTLLAATPGVEQVLDRAGQTAYGLDHERTGDLVVVAEPRAWFTYYYWLDDERAPDFARGVEIHRKPGYDPAELFFDPADRSAKARAGLSLVRKKLGLRYAMKVVPLDPRWVRGSHGRLPDDPVDGPVVIASDAALRRESVAAADVHDLVLEAAGVAVAQPSHP
ncbi:alkaline phosphatase family protein [Terrabacter sp. MAHUQ-38]|uniref:alkaline phosphatase family protein n=1 Tax=unclassified Terrabacter TaxID=2630222 RepID=UPI00165E0AEB|nr:nucleotide pyrophosphatase/phosphodiesterase family protein [Terrabacter sp. MAHUQ-38]MBC9820637.1 alkaline phosphatase family protein [Terrabacter sp. MAHUQ-38]